LAGVSQPAFKKNTIKTYQSILSKLTNLFGERDLNSLTPEEILSFLTAINQGTKPLTKHTRYSQVNAFFNFITQNLAPNFRNPCNAPMLRKLYRPSGPICWKILEKEVMDKIIFRTTKPKNRLILELMAQSGKVQICPLKPGFLLRRLTTSSLQKTVGFRPFCPLARRIFSEKSFVSLF
jgi:site-specific recombinase XerD